MSVSHGPHDAPVLRLTLEPGPDAPSGARAAIADFSVDQGLDTDTLATVMLLVSELVTNAVVHPELQEPADIRLTARRFGTMVRVEITDRGGGFTPQERDPARVDGGYGLYLLNKAADRWGIEHDDGTTVWFEVSGRA
jgi:anti-sigma regulatory factor (Ser/Thr protein kinase)